MRARTLAVASSTGVLVVLVAAVMLAFLVLGMNGFQEAKATRVFVGYFGLVACVVLGSAMVSTVIDARIHRAAGWPSWVVAPIAVGFSTLLAGGMLFFGGIALMLALGLL